MKKCLFIILLLSLIDAALTYIGIKAGYIEEANPLLADIFRTTPELAVLSVMVFVCAMVLIISRYGGKVRWTIYGLAVIIAVKFYVVFAHISWIKEVV